MICNYCGITNKSVVKNKEHEKICKVLRTANENEFDDELINANTNLLIKTLIIKQAKMEKQLAKIKNTLKMKVKFIDWLNENMQRTNTDTATTSTLPAILQCMSKIVINFSNKYEMINLYLTIFDFIETSIQDNIEKYKEQYPTADNWAILTTNNSNKIYYYDEGKWHDDTNNDVINTIYFYLNNNVSNKLMEFLLDTTMPAELTTKYNIFTQQLYTKTAEQKIKAIIKKNIQTKFTINLYSISFDF